MRTIQAQSTPRLILMLSVCAFILFLACLFYGVIIPQTPGRMERPSAALIPEEPLWAALAALPLPIPRHPHLVAVCLIGVAIVMFAAYGLAVYISWRQPAHAKSLGLVGGAALLFFLVGALALPNVNTDIFNYIMRGRVAAVYMSNPYVVPADTFPDDPIYPYASHRYTKYTGGKLPAWMLVNIGLASISGHHPSTVLFVYRLAFLLCNAANLALIALILHQLRSPFMLTGLIIYAWNPIIAIYGQSKTDTLMVFFLLLAVLLITRGSTRLAVIPLGCSAAVKLITLPLIIVYGLRELRLRRWHELAWLVLLLGLTVMGLYAPFWEGDNLLFRHLRMARGGGSEASSLFRPLLVAGFGGLLLWAGFRQDGSNQKLLRSWAVVMLYFALFLTKISFAWYLMTLVALVGLIVEWRFVLSTILLSFSSFLFNSWQATTTPAFPLPNLFSLPRLVVYLTPLSLVVLCIILYILWQTMRQQRQAQSKRLASDPGL